MMIFLKTGQMVVMFRGIQYFCKPLYTHSHTHTHIHTHTHTQKTSFRSHLKIHTEKNKIQSIKKLHQPNSKTLVKSLAALLWISTCHCEAPRAERCVITQ